MKISLLKIWVRWRRFRRGALDPRKESRHYAPQVESLMARANPFASWDERCNWIIDCAEWVRRAPLNVFQGRGSRQHMRQHRVKFLLDWLDAHRETRKLVRATLQKTLREAAGPELFSATGMPREPAFFSEFSERIIKRALPRLPGEHDLSALFTAMFPDRADHEWLSCLDHKLLSRLSKLCTDEGIVHGYRKQIDEALIYLVTMVVAAGVSPEFRQRLGPKLPLPATPFMALRRELEALLAVNLPSEAALRSVRMLIAVCQAQTDKIYAHLDEFGVSVSLVYALERMRAQLARIARLIDLRAALMHSTQGTGTSAVHLRELLVDLNEAHHHRASIRGLVRRNFSLLARKMVERNADHGEQYIARNGAQYAAMFKAAGRGGVVLGFTILARLSINGLGLVRFFEGALLSAAYAASFLAVSASGGVLATKQPAMTATALAARMNGLDTVEGLRALVHEIGCMLRSQAAAVLGNVSAVVPTIAVFSAIAWLARDDGLMTPANAAASLDALSIWGLTPLFAIFTGVLLWLSSLAAGFADNWFALRRLREALAHNRRLVHALGAARARRWSEWLERHISGIAGNVSLGLMLGMAPVAAHVFGLPFEVRHVSLATGTLAAAAMSLDWSVLRGAPFWLAVAGILITGLLNVGVAFGCALALALRAREVPARVRRVVRKTVWRRFAARPWAFLLPAASVEAPGNAAAAQADEGNGSDAVGLKDRFRR